MGYIFGQSAVWKNQILLIRSGYFAVAGMEARAVSILCAQNTIRRQDLMVAMAAGAAIFYSEVIKTYGPFSICGILKMCLLKMVKVAAAITVQAEREKIVL